MSAELQVVIAFIQPFQLDAVVDAVRRIPNFPGMSVSDVRGFGAHAAHPPREGERSEVHAFETRLRLEVFCRLEDATAIVETIRGAAHTGHAGDGKVFAGPVSLAYRVRTGEWGESAVLCTARPTRAAEEGCGVFVSEEEAAEREGERARLGTPAFPRASGSGRRD